LYKILLPLSIKINKNQWEAGIGFISKVQVIQRGEKNQQSYFICLAPLPQALETEEGESIEG
jgi:hypothetical protein